MRAVIIVRDRMSYARRCAEALTAAGLDVFLVDHGSTYPPLLDWYRDGADGLPVVLRGDAHPRSLWESPVLHRVVGRAAPYAVTDPDVVPAPGCPPDWPAYLADALARNPGWVKAGLSLRIRDLPDHYRHAARVREWEGRLRVHEQVPGWWTAGVDTTLAVYRPLGEVSRFALHPALRAKPPHEALHLTWYEDSANPSDETTWYADKLPPLVSHWSDPERYERGDGR